MNERNNCCGYEPNAFVTKLPNASQELLDLLKQLGAKPVDVPLYHIEMKAIKPLERPAGVIFYERFEYSESKRQKTQ